MQIVFVSLFLTADYSQIFPVAVSFKNVAVVYSLSRSNADASFLEEHDAAMEVFNSVTELTN